MPFIEKVIDDPDRERRQVPMRSPSLRLSSTSCQSEEEIEVLRQERINNVSPDSKVSVVEVQWFCSPSDSQPGHRGGFQMTRWSKPKHS